MLAAPVLAGDAHAALHFVEDEQHLVLVANAAQGAEQFAAEMIVAALALDRLDNDGGDIGAFLPNEFHDLRFGAFFLRDDVGFALCFRQREVDARSGNARPGELREEAVLRGSVFVRLIV